jgi:hypothetical protein
MEHVTVVEIVDGWPEVILYVGEHDEIVRKAQTTFLDICRENIWNFDEYTQDDITVILDNGYETWGDNCVAIVWPEVK